MSSGSDRRPLAEASATVHRVDRDHQHCTLESFRWDWLENDPAGVAAAVRDFQDAHLAGEAPHLLLLGPQGTGKTHLLYGLYRWAVWHADLSEAVAFHVGTFCRDVKRAFDGNVPDPWGELRRARFMALDDLFGRDLTDWETSQVLAPLIDVASRDRMSLVVTDNRLPEQLEAKLNPHEASRLFARATVVWVTGRDRRPEL